jgi:O-antigen/teichoic acid export membrane protein
MGAHRKGASPTAVAAVGSTASLSRRGSLNAVAAGLDFLARIVVELLVTPLLVGRLGAALYGAWRVLWQWSGYVWATSGRSSQALQSAIANRQRSPDVAEKRAYVASAVLVWFLFLPLLVTVGALGVWAVPHLLDTEPRYVREIRWAATLLVLDSIVLTLLTVPRSVLQGENLGFKRMGWSAGLVLLGGGITALAVVLDMGIVGVAGANLVNTCLTGWLFWRVTRTHVPWFGLARPSRDALRWFVGLSSWFLGWKLVFELMTASDVIILGTFASVSLVTVYVLTKFVAEALSRLLVIVVNGATPGLGGLVGAGSLRKVIRVRGELMSVTWLILTAAGSSIIVWNRSFVGLWVGERFYAGHLETLLIVLVVVQFSLIRNDTYLIDVTLDLRVKVLFGALSTAVSIALAILLVARFDGGVAGLCAGILAGRFLLTVVYPWQIGRTIGYPLVDQVRAVIRPVATTALLFGAAMVIGSEALSGSWLTVGSAAVLTAAVAAAAAAWLGLTRGQRVTLYRRTRAVAGRG